MKVKVIKKNKKGNMEVNGIGENGIVDGPCEYSEFLNHWNNWSFSIHLLDQMHVWEFLIWEHYTSYATKEEDNLQCF